MPASIEMAHAASLARGLDGSDALGVFFPEMPSTLEDLERVFLVGQAQPFGLVHAHQHHLAARRLPCLGVRGLPGQEDEGIAFAPGWPLVFIKRRPPIMGALWPSRHDLSP
ncbi:mlr1442 [Mesorhizobium japonicum MAFF 303099]|uniref:Mlr1442 protein n=1 Tax=Mesorhizobium japonicum (strain LMG 29417 / CECT 9101 / MAFF 303099) TaxID=266835 RepID=Q98KJ8_RHILO|nr:mlr1442 [Mesorhizobium japonicum MAFF 303099]